MNINPKQVFVLASGLTAIFSTGYVVTQIPMVISEIQKENTKRLQAQETTKQIEQTTKQMEQTIRESELELEAIKLLKKWW
jgi:uncharacterized membrane protein